MKSPMQHSRRSPSAAWLPLVLASAGCSMDLSLGDLSREGQGLIDDGASAAVTPTVDGALAPALAPPEVTFGMSDPLRGMDTVVGTDLDADGHDDLAMAAHDVATGIDVVHIRYGGPRPGGAEAVYRLAEGGARLVLPGGVAERSTVDGLFAAGDVDGDGYADLLVASGICDGPGLERGGYLIYGGPERLDGVIDIASVSTHFTPPASPGDGSACAYASFAAPGDIDGDELSDLAFVYPGSLSYWTYSGEEPTITSGSPGIYVFYGRQQRFGASVPWASADARMSSTLSDDPARERDALTVHAVGDLNGDGRAEFGVTYVSSDEYFETPQGSPFPRTQQILVPGGQRPSSPIDLLALPLQIPGLITQRGQNPLGDLDGDGYDDILARFGQDYMLFYGAPDLLDAPLDRARAAARIVTEHNGGPLPLGDLDGDGDSELGVMRYLPHRPYVETIDLAVLSGTRARLHGDITFATASLEGARIYPRSAYADTRAVSFVASVGDFDGDGAGDVLTESATDADAVGDAYPMLHLHYGQRAEPAASTDPR